MGRLVFGSVFSRLDEAHRTVESNLLYSQSPDLKVNATQSTLAETSSRIMFDHISGHCGPAKVTDEISHCSPLALL